MKRLFKSALLLLTIFCGSCVSTTPQVTTAEYLNTQTMEEDFETPVVISTLKTSITPSFTSTPENILLPLSDLPTWLGDSNSRVLHLLNFDPGNGVEHIFINAASSESYSFPAPYFAKGYFFESSRTLGLVSTDFENIYYVDLHTGQVDVTDFGSENVRTIGDVSGYRELIQKRVETESGELVIWPGWSSNYVSMNGTYTFNREGYEDEWTIRVYENLSGELIYESNPEDGLWDIEAVWSPTNDRHIAVVQGRMQQQDPYYVISDRVEIVDVSSQLIVSQFEGDFGNIEWSDDGEKILYLDGLSYYWNYGEHFKGSPCILNIVEGSSECLQAIPNTHLQPNYDVEWIFDVQWGSDDRYIYYIVYTYLDKEISYICRYDSQNGEIDCPDLEAAGFSDYVVIGYDVSPEDDYLYLCLRQFGPGAGGPCTDAILSVDSSVSHFVTPMDFGSEGSAALAEISWLPSR